MTYKIGDIFNNDKEYTARAQWCNDNGYFIQEIEQKNGERRFQICAPAETTLSELKPVPTNEQLAATARAKRDRLIESVRWRIERHNDEVALGREPTEPLEPLLQYTQALRDVPQQAGFPEKVEWPEL